METNEQKKNIFIMKTIKYCHLKTHSDCGIFSPFVMDWYWDRESANAIFHLIYVIYIYLFIFSLSIVANQFGLFFVSCLCKKNLIIFTPVYWKQNRIQLQCSKNGSFSS